MRTMCCYTSRTRCQRGSGSRNQATGNRYKPRYGGVAAIIQLCVLHGIDPLKLPMLVQRYFHDQTRENAKRSANEYAGVITRV